jgi:RNA polymerase sigma-70 factor (ECF subfamily)
MERTEEETLDVTSFNQEYLQRLRDGDPETQRHFTRYFGELLNIKLRNRIRSPHLIEEVRQETFLRVLLIVRRDGIAHPERLGAFVNSVCNNVVLEVFRSETRSLPMPDTVPEVMDEAPNPESAAYSRQQNVQVRGILDSLPAKDRDLLRQIFLEERDKDEVCRTFQVDREYLRVLLHRAKARFRAALEQAAGAA